MSTTALRRHAPLANAPRFQARLASQAGIDGVELTDAAGGARAFFARRGATLIDWRVRHGDAWLALTDGYRDAGELAGQDGVRNGVLAPFPNRIADGRYHFEGRDYDLLPGVPAGGRRIYHGFVRATDMELDALAHDEDGARASFSTLILPETHPGYPFALTIQVEVALSARGIALRITATNVGPRTAPYACGWHPYFRLGDAPLAGLALTVPASRIVVTDPALIPLPGARALRPLGAWPVLDFRDARGIGARVLDHCYAGAGAQATGRRIESRLRDPASGCSITVWQERGLTHVFTGDTLARDARRAVAIEPVETMTDAFNRPECAAELRLLPGASRSFSCGAQFHPPTDLRQ